MKIKTIGLILLALAALTLYAEPVFKELANFPSDASTTSPAAADAAATNIHTNTNNPPTRATPDAR